MNPNNDSTAVNIQSSNAEETPVNLQPTNEEENNRLQPTIEEENESRQLIVDDESRVPKMQLWERKLLDFSLRNNLLNLRVRSKVVQVAATDIGLLEDALQDGATMTPVLWNEEKAEGEKTQKLKIQPMDEAGVIDSHVLDEAQQKAVAEGLKKKHIMTYLDDDDLQNALKALHRAARTALEENGANSLYMVLGMLRWKELGNKYKWRYAPILLLPMEIVRHSGGRFVLRMRDEDVILNTTLVELMRQQYQMDFSALSPLPMDEHGVDVNKVLQTVRDIISSHQDWSVVEEAVLGLFSFSKFVMWNDIHTSAEKMLTSTIIQSLVTGTLKVDVSQEGADARRIDKQQQPSAFAVPLDVDSSQLEAVVESGEGKSFILHGPPGTGKSQTITNMIANALYNGRRVLFVAEKMAALSVVQKRLEKIGLGPFCLEMHSNKATKTHLLAQLDRALEVSHRADSKTYAERSQQLFQQRQQLIAYMEALHTKSQRGLSVYDCISQWLALKGEEMPVSETLLTTLTAERLNQIDQWMEEADQVLISTGHPADHPLRPFFITDTSLTAGDRLTGICQDLTNCIQSAVTAGIPDTLCLRDIIQLQALQNDAVKKQQAAQNGCQASILQQDGKQLSALFTQANDKWFLPKFFAKKKLRKQLRAHGFNGEWEEIGPLAQRLTAYQTAYAAWQQQMTVSHLNESLLPTIYKILADSQQIGVAGQQSHTLSQLTQLAQTLTAYSSKVHTWSLWCMKHKELMEQGLTEVANYLINQHVSGQETARALRKNAMRRLALQGIDANPQLQTFNGLIFEQLIEKYRALAKEFQNLTKEELYFKLAARIPSVTMEAASSSEMGILKRCIKSKARGMTIRQLIDHIPTLLPRLCPCMLMSPLSVAQYLDLEREKFDIVVFDEASQMPTSEAVGAIARGKALVVVGDPMQMPPTSFFSTTNVGEDEADIDDMESILDDCITLSMPSRYLTWHYRSKHESLIAFSNSQYYGSRLFTFPSVDDRVSKVQFVPVQGVYDMGKTRCNRDEANAIVTEVIRRLSDPELRKRSLGIVSFSKVQQSLIEDVLVSRLAEHPELEALAYDGEEPIFIKNLENVQGDERDVILFSVGYGPDKDGKVSMNFGPLNNTGGERRLNVAVSRARYEMMIFSSMRPDQIDLNRTQAEGVKGLKKFLEFAMSGRNVEPANTAGTTSQAPAGQASGLAAASEQALVNAIAAELEARGYTVDRAVGRSNFKIDIAVLDPEQPDTYILGILCDGKNYFETKTERDREICQPSVLKMLGWNIMRVWSVDWFLNREEVMQRIINALTHQEEPKPATEENASQPAANTPETPTKVPAEEPKTQEPAVSPEISHPYYPANILPPTGQTGVAGMQRYTAKLKQHIQRIIKAEQPITFSLLCKRIAALWGATNTQKLQDIVQQNLGTAYLDPLMFNDFPFYWAEFEPQRDYRIFRTGSDRDITDIPMIEIMNAIRYAVEQQIAIPLDDLRRQTAKLLGYSRATERVLAHIDHAVATLLEDLTLRIDNGFVKMSEE